jgi:hypothetical protein
MIVNFTCFTLYQFINSREKIDQKVAKNLGQHIGNHSVQLPSIFVELPNAIGQLVGGHLVLVQHPAEHLLVHVDLLDVGCLG